ncbi:hypothetical protein CsSME_00050148 [Camellia sinensis var. sinensis]
MLTTSSSKKQMSCSNVASFAQFSSIPAYSILASLYYSHHWTCSGTCFMRWRLGERTGMVQTRVLWEVTSQICLISQCSIHPSMVPSLKEHTDFLWDIKWMPPTIVSDRTFFQIFTLFQPFYIKSNFIFVKISIFCFNCLGCLLVPDLRLKWHVPCGPNSVITFPGASWLKPWYWWAWPVLPLGIQWHEQRRQTLGYSAEMPVVFIQSIFYLGIMAVTRLARPNLSKLCYRRADKSTSLIQASLKLVALWSILAAYIIPFFLIPCTVHPLLGWSLYLLGAFSLSSIAVNAFLLPILPVLVPWLGILGTLLVMAYPWYPNGIVRALSVFGYAFCCAPVLWGSLVKIMSCLQVSLEREAFLPRLGESTSPPEFKLY